MVVIERTHNIVRARVMVSYLQAHGVEARLLDAEMTTMVPFLSGGVRIAVPDDEENQARRLLKEAEKEF
ncbi:MAG: DUF2007 domain-containing protein [Pseudomonadota bacterium]